MTLETKRKMIEAILQNLPDDVFEGILQDVEIDQKKATTVPAGENNLEKRIFNMLLELGVPAHIKGHGYLRESILFYMENPGCSTTKVLYPEVAKKFATTPSRVERAIRHAIDVCWDRGNAKIFEEVFGYSVNPARGKPTNSEFIAMICEHLRMDS